MTRIALLLAILATHCVRCDDAALQSFSHLGATEQVAALGRANETHCAIKAAYNGFLAEIAMHGEQSVDAVLPYLDGHDAAFPRRDALTVLRNAAARGTNIAKAEPALQRIAATAQNAEERNAAAAVLRERRP